MSDQLATLIDEVRGMHPPTPFASPAAVRRRGRQRAHRQALAAGAATFAVVGLGAGLPWVVDVDHRGGPVDGTSSTAGATSSSAALPAPLGTDVPSSLMLRPGDVGASVRVEEVDDQGPDGPDWPWAMPPCSNYRARDYPSRGAVVSARLLAYAEGGSSRAFEWVERHSAGGGPAAFQDVLRVVGQCPSYRDMGLPTYEPGTGWAVTNEVLARDVAGDDSLLVRRRATPVGMAAPERIECYVTVRVGDLIATVRLPNGDEAEARALGERAAARLG
ncbi:MAG TPA: hypothetical protein VGJ63_08795 [Micromonosporaceae bacterium]|jgi:hypothetical protein